MDHHRRVSFTAISFYPILSPFSCFDFVEDHFGGQEAIRRIFSLARSFENVKTLIVENILGEGIIEDENSEIKEFYNDYTCLGIQRISFWNRSISTIDDLTDASDENFYGYAILKCDSVSSLKIERWHVFEAVIQKYRHPHNFIPFSKYYSVSIGTMEFRIQGLLYCQQNGLNKACAHVALKSLLSRLIPDRDITYRKINEIARSAGEEDYSPGDGLSVVQMRAVFKEFNLQFRDVDYMQHPDLKKAIPYQKWVYAGVESGGGALVGFRLATRPSEPESRHIIPFFGHTFNKDTWAPEADFAYFQIGNGLGYIPSESWTSSLIGHDDNFGPNFCIPRLYIDQEKVEYVVELFKPGTRYSGVAAEVSGLEFLYSMIPHISSSENVWLSRLIEWTMGQHIILRAVSLSKSHYKHHFQQLRDWEGNAEKSDVIDALCEGLPANIYMVEISTTHLFPANKRKLGEIILDATIEISNVMRRFNLPDFRGGFLFVNQLMSQECRYFLFRQAMLCPIRSYVILSKVYFVNY